MKVSTVSSIDPRASIDSYLELLRDVNLAPDKRVATVRLLIQEIDELTKYHEELEFAESRAARGRELIDQCRARLNKPKHLADHAEAVRVLSNLKSIQRLLDRFCHQLRSTGNPGLSP